MKMKKALALVLCIAMVLSTMTTVVFADSNLITNFTLRTSESRRNLEVALEPMVTANTNLTLKVYSGETQLSETNLNQDLLGTAIGTGNIVISGKESSSWATTWLVAPSYDKMPTKVVANIDGREYEFEGLYYHDVVTPGGEYYLVTEDMWNDVEGVKSAPTGTITPAYTYATGVWGEATCNATESLVVELYDADGNRMAYTSLNNIDGIIDGDVYVTWNMNYGSNDEYWNVVWENGQPNINVVPATVALLVDGVKVADNVAKLNAPDDLNPIEWKDVYGVSYADITYAGYVGTSGEFGTESYRENIQVDLYDVFARESLVVELWSKGEKLSTTSLRAADRDDETVKLLPYSGTITANIVVKGRLSGSWDTEWHAATTASNVPDTIKVYADGALVDTYASAFTNDTELEEYYNLTGVYTAAKIGEERYGSLKDALDDAKADGLTNVTVEILGDVDLSESKDGIALANSMKGFEKITLNGTAMQNINMQKNNNKYHAIDSVIEFNNLTINYTYNDGNYTGIAHNNGQIYNNCVINGVFFVRGTQSIEFNNCTFNVTGNAYNVWTYGGKITTFNTCKFYSDGKSLLAYDDSDGAGEATNKIFVNDCEFYATSSYDGKAAIEIDASIVASAIEISNSSAIGFDEGSVSGDMLWNVKKTTFKDISKTSLTVNGETVDLDAYKETVNENKPVIKVEFEEVTTNEGERLYNINLVSDSEINRLNAVDLTFTFDGTNAVADGAMDFEIISSNDEIEFNPVDNSKFRYEFHYNGKDGVLTDTAEKITLGQVKVYGYGTFTLGVADSTYNKVQATTLANNIVDTYVSTGVVEGAGKLDIEESSVTETIDVPSRELIINITFPNVVVDKAAAYQDMEVTIVGGNVDETIALGGGTNANAAYTITRELPYNTTYTVTVEGAGYRTARYAVTLRDDATLNFWNNVMDNKLEVEVGKANSAVNHNFLAGDIVKDNNINIYDLSAVVSYFGTEGLSVENNPQYAKYDLNRDGVIDSKDVAYVLVSWNN